MNTSRSALPNKPIFATSDFAVPVESPGYIDATAEETCPAPTAPMSEHEAPQLMADDVEAPSAATLEVMDQLKALAHNVTQSESISSGDSDASDLQPNMNAAAVASDAGALATEPSISVFPRPTGLENIQAVSDRPKFGKILTLAGFAMAALIGAGSSFAWQTYLQPQDVAKAAAPVAAASAPVVAPYVGRQLEELSEDISSLHRRMEELTSKQQQLVAAQQQLDQLAAKQQQLAAKQEQVGQSVAKLHSLEQARQKTSASVQYRPAPVPLRSTVPPPPPIEPAMQPPFPPRVASHPVPPLPVPP